MARGGAECVVPQARAGVPPEAFSWAGDAAGLGGIASWHGGAVPNEAVSGSVGDLGTCSTSSCALEPMLAPPL